MTLTHIGASELAHLMEGTTAGALIPEIVRRGFQDLLEAEISALRGAQLHERCPDKRSTHRNGYRHRLLNTQGGDLSLAILAPNSTLQRAFSRTIGLIYTWQRLTMRSGMLLPFV